MSPQNYLAIGVLLALLADWSAVAQDADVASLRPREAEPPTVDFDERAVVVRGRY
jgi:hypothetical protein